MRRFTGILVLGSLLLAACGAGVATPGTLPATVVNTPVQPTQRATSTPSVTPPPIVQTEEDVMPDPAPQSGGDANADVLFVRAIRESGGAWTFYVTVEHPDTGWEDYADGWDVVLPDGTVVKPDPDSPFTRLLLHPHESEQPFTRSQSGIVIPEGVTQVTIRAHDLVDGFGGREVIVDLAAGSGADFEIERE